MKKKKKETNRELTYEMKFPVFRLGIFRLCKCIVQSTCAIATAHQMRREYLLHIGSYFLFIFLARIKTCVESICRCVMAPVQAATYFVLSLSQCFRTFAFSFIDKSTHRPAAFATAPHIYLSLSLFLYIFVKMWIFQYVLEL